MNGLRRWLLAGLLIGAGPLLPALAPAAAAQESGSPPPEAPAGALPPGIPAPPPRPPSLLDRFLPVRVGAAAKEGEGRDLSTAVEIVLLLTFLTLLPPLLLTVTCFTRIVVVLSFVRRAMSTPELPPNPVLIGLALFLTGAVMAPTGRAIHARAVEPYLEGRLEFAPAAQAASGELKRFLLTHARHQDVALFMELSRSEPVEGPEAIPLTVAVPAFIVSELRTAFQMGFVLYLPFLVIDLVVASVLLAMGMYMLPPMLIATPLKILLFVLVDGWGLVIQQVWKGLAT